MDKILSQIKQRILQYIDFKGIKKEYFFEITGISASNFKGEGLKSDLGGDKIAKILSNFPDLNPTWLMTEKGDMCIMPLNKLDIDHLTESRNQQINGENGANVVDTRHSMKLYESLKKKRPELFNLKRNFDILIYFNDAIQEIDSALYHPVLLNVLWKAEGKFDYKQYEKTAIDKLSKLLPFEKPLSKITAAIIEFYQEMELVPDNTIDFEDYTV
jgi:hypothetical protein